jgi:hypothetical protein
MGPVLIDERPARRGSHLNRFRAWRSVRQRSRILDSPRPSG